MTEFVRAAMPATVVSVDVVPGTTVRAGATLVVLESMKMEHVVVAPIDGIVCVVRVDVGATIATEDVLVELEATSLEPGFDTQPDDEHDLARVRPDLAAVVERHEVGHDERRPEAVERRHARGQRTARENIADLVDAGSFVEYAPLVVAAQRRRRPLQELIERTPGDGLVGGVGTVDGVPTIAMTYDYSVLAGTQGLWNHLKKDRLFELAERLGLPVVFFTEGGGGRPGDTDGLGVSGLDCAAFNLFARLSGTVPLIGIASGYCFAGNAALLGCCDVVIATARSNIGMGGPAMIEGGGLGTFAPTDIGPAAEQVESGVVDVLVADETEAVVVARRYLRFLRGPIEGWECSDQRELRHLVPENRVRAYDIRAVIATMFDTDSVLELRRGFGAGMVTAFARVEGRPLGVVANNPAHLGGAIDSDAADKAARFLQLCDSYALPVVFLCDTPGFMVGPESERTGAVRHMSRLFVTGANLSVPTATIVLRKGYGLGAQAMAAGSFKAPVFTIAWPTGEFGGMNLEGAVRLGMKRELDAIADDAERAEAEAAMVERMYEAGKAINTATYFEIDDVIDPADSRRWITMLLTSATNSDAAPGRNFIDTW